MRRLALALTLVVTACGAPALATAPAPASIPSPVADDLGPAGALVIAPVSRRAGGVPLEGRRP